MKINTRGYRARARAIRTQWRAWRTGDGGRWVYDPIETARSGDPTFTWEVTP